MPKTAQSRDLRYADTGCCNSPCDTRRRSKDRANFLPARKLLIRMVFGPYEHDLRELAAQLPIKERSL
jgi:hypothetical protein